MKRIWTLMLCTFALILGLLAFGNNKTIAATTDPSSEIGYVVSAELPDNQINNKVSYFDLKVTPGSSQDLKIHIKNTSSSPQKFLVEVNRATTNVNGIIDYNYHNTKKGPSLKTDIQEMFSKPQKVTVPANTDQVVTLHMQTPNKKITGMVLGGIRVLRLNQNQKTNESVNKLNIENHYAYLIGLQIQQNTDGVKPDLKLVKGVVSQNDHQADVAARLVNDTPTIINDGEIDASVTPEGGSNKVLQLSKKNLQFAPNTRFDFPVNYSDQTLKPGRYTMRISAKGDEGTQVWHLTKNFKVTKADSNKLNKVAANAPSVNNTSTKKPNYVLIFSLAALAAALIIGLLIWNFKLMRRGRD